MAKREHGGNQAIAGGRPKPERPAASRPKKKEIYRALARLYGYTPSDIAEMTPYAQLAMLGGADSDEAQFATEAEYRRFLRDRVSNG